MKVMLTQEEAILWLREVHVPDAPPFRSAMLEGNEDCPNLVRLWARQYPDVYEAPVAQYKVDEDGNLKRF